MFIITGISTYTGNEVYWNGRKWTAFALRVRTYRFRPTSKTFAKAVLAGDWLVDGVQVKEISLVES